MKKNGGRKRVQFRDYEELHIWRFGAVRARCCWAGVRGHASVALLMGEPYGDFGRDVSDRPCCDLSESECARRRRLELRMCHNGELGVVVSRYQQDRWL